MKRRTVLVQMMKCLAVTALAAPAASIAQRATRPIRPINPGRPGVPLGPGRIFPRTSGVAGPRPSPVYLRLVRCRLAKVSCGYATLTVVAQTYM